MVSLHLAPEALREESAALVKLARSLLRHTHDAEDAAQDAWLAALQHEPDAGRDVRPWLATVTRNLTRRRRRQSARAAARERSTARREALPASADVVTRVEIHRRVVDAVLALDAPYRDVILLRFWDGMPPRRIARRLGLPVATVRTRVHRGLARLRARLDRLGGGRTAWLSLLALQVPRGPGSGAAATTASAFGSLALMSIPVKASAAALAAAVLLGLSWHLLVPAAPPVEPAATETTLLEAPATVHTAPPPTATPPREVIPEPAPRTVASSAAHRVIGRVLSDATGLPLRDAEVVLMGRFRSPGEPAPITRSDAQGRFALDVSIVRAGTSSRDFEVVAADHARLFGALDDRRGLDRSPIDLGDLRLLRGTEIRGRVLDRLGVPVAGAKLFFLFDLDRTAAMLRFDLLRPAGESGADGTFTLPERLGGSRFEGGHLLLATTDTEIGWADLHVVVGRESVDDVVIRPHGTATLEVRVEDEDQRPIAGVPVRAAPRFAPFVKTWTPPLEGPELRVTNDVGVRCAATTDDAGVARFARLPLDGDGEGPLGSPYELVSSMPSRLLARAEPRLHPGANPTITLMLRRQRAVEITGQVTDQDDAPIAHATVKALEQSTETDAQGRYALSGMAPASGKILIEVSAADHGTMSVPIAVPADGSLRADFALDRLTPISGRVVDQLGQPVTDVSLTLEQDGRGAFIDGPIGPDGRFSFSNVGPGTWLMSVSTSPDSGLEASQRFPVTAGTRDLEIVVQRVPPGTCRVFVELVDVRTGKPVDPVSAFLSRLPHDLGPTTSAHLERAAGVVRSDPIRAGRWRLEVTTREGTVVHRELEIAEGDIEKHLRIEVGPPGVVLASIRFDALPAERRPEQVSLVVLPDADGVWTTAPGIPAPNATKGFARVVRDGSHEVRLEQVPIDERLTLSCFDDGEEVFGDAVVTVPPQGEARVEIVLSIPGRAAFDVEGVPPGAIGELFVGANAFAEATPRHRWTAPDQPARERVEVALCPGTHEWRLRIQPPRVSAAPSTVIERKGTIDVVAGQRSAVHIDARR
jgi:RNA polymerase sigma-70 factor (ECF subfamily)